MSFPYVIASIENNALTCSEKMTLVSLANRANDKGVCFPSLDTLAQDTGQSSRNVHRCICALRDKGLIAWSKQTDTQDRRKKKNVYSLNLQIIKRHIVMQDTVAEETINIDSLPSHSGNQSDEGFTTARSLSELAG